MKQLQLLFIFCFTISIQAKEWKSLKAYNKETQKTELSSSDWLCSDRNQNSLVWKRANTYNLLNNRFQEYETIIQRRDFYFWFSSEISKKGHDVLWPKMAHFISNKLRLINMFPYFLFINKRVKNHALQGSIVVFNLAFEDMKVLYNSDVILKGNDALQWDERILYKEQYEWIAPIYKSMDSKSLNTIERMAKGKGFYSLMVPKVIRFKGDMSIDAERYNYAIHSLRDYCENTYD